MSFQLRGNSKGKKILARQGGSPIPKLVTIMIRSRSSFPMSAPFQRGLAISARFQSAPPVPKSDPFYVSLSFLFQLQR